MIKIEPNFIMRGRLYPLEHTQLCQRVNTDFHSFLSDIPMLASAELYAGKLCAALNRQHPRDLFDVKLLLENEGITDEIRHAFVVYLAGDNRPMYEMLSPNRLDIRDLFEREFRKMTEIDVSLDNLLEVREQMIAHLNCAMTTDERQFLLSVKQGAPEYALMPFENLDQFPSLQWKTINVRRMARKKHQAMLSKLRDVLEI
jgi:hypothetical protein